MTVLAEPVREGQIRSFVTRDRYGDEVKQIYVVTDARSDPHALICFLSGRDKGIVILWLHQIVMCDEVISG